MSKFTDTPEGKTGGRSSEGLIPPSIETGPSPSDPIWVDEYNLRRWSPFETKCLKEIRASPKLAEKLANRPQYTDIVGDRRLLRFLRGKDYDLEKNY